MEDNQGLSAISQASLGDVAYEKIANAIISGAFKPGEKLTIRNLADRLETSSTPVRDAVKRLLLEGALEQRAARDIRVPIITADRYREIADIRLELEGLAAERAAERRTDADISALEKNISDNEIAMKADDWERCIVLNKQFHFALAETANMPILSSHLDGLWLQIGPPISSFYAHGGRDMIDHHYDVFDAIKAQKPSEARQHIVSDIASSVDHIIAHIEQAASK